MYQTGKDQGDEIKLLKSAKNQHERKIELLTSTLDIKEQQIVQLLKSDEKNKEEIKTLKLKGK